MSYLPKASLLIKLIVYKLHIYKVLLDEAIIECYVSTVKYNFYFY